MKYCRSREAKPYIIHNLQPTAVPRKNREYDKRIWSDEVYISSAGIFKRHNVRSWSHESDHKMFTERRSELLDEQLTELLDNIPFVNAKNSYFQQDNAPAHNSDIIKHFLIYISLTE